MFGVRCWMFDVESVSWQKHPHFLQPAKVGSELDASFDVKAVFDRARVNDLADGNARRKNSAQPAADDVLARFQVGMARVGVEFDQRAVEWAGRANDAGVAGVVVDE